MSAPADPSPGADPTSPAPRHPTPSWWLTLVVAVVAAVPFALLGDLVGASERATLFLRAAVSVFTVIAVLFWRALHSTFGRYAGRVGIVGIAFAAFVAMTLVSRMASFPEHLFALPFLFPVWLALVLWVGSTLTLRAARVTGG